MYFSLQIINIPMSPGTVAKEYILFYGVLAR